MVLPRLSFRQRSAAFLRAKMLETTNTICSHANFARNRKRLGERWKSRVIRELLPIRHQAHNSCRPNQRARYCTLFVCAFRLSAECARSHVHVRFVGVEWQNYVVDVVFNNTLIHYTLLAKTCSARTYISQNALAIELNLCEMLAHKISQPDRTFSIHADKRTSQRVERFR